MGMGTRIFKSFNLREAESPDFYVKSFILNASFAFYKCLNTSVRQWLLWDDQ